MIGYWIDEHFGWFITLGCAVVFGLIVWTVVHDEHAWEDFSATHHCVKVGEISDSVGVGVGVSSDGAAVPTTVYVPGKTGWKCDDGATYWR